MPDTRHLLRRGKCWHIRIRRPPKSWGLDIQEVMLSLHTPDLKVAQRLRDLHAPPWLHESNLLDGFRRMVRRIARHDDEVAAILPGDHLPHPEPTISRPAFRSRRL